MYWFKRIKEENCDSTPKQHWCQQWTCIDGILIILSWEEGRLKAKETMNRDIPSAELLRVLWGHYPEKLNAPRSWVSGTRISESCCQVLLGWFSLRINLRIVTRGKAGWSTESKVKDLPDQGWELGTSNWHYAQRSLTKSKCMRQL